MGTYKFTGNNTFFNNICSSRLTYSSHSGSGTEPLECWENTCISPLQQEDQPISTCRTTLLPSGQVNKNFEWGVEGDPWTLTVDYSKHYGISSNYEFIGPTAIQLIPPVAETGCLYITIQRAGGTSILINKDLVSGGFATNPFTALPYNPQGYTAMASQPLNGMVIDPAKHIGTNYFEPIRNFQTGECYVGKVKYEEPIITYYDVGTREVPEPHEVIYKNMIVPLSGELDCINPRAPTAFVTAVTGRLPKSPYRTYTYYPPTLSGEAAYFADLQAYIKNKQFGTCVGAGYDPDADPPMYPDSWYATRYTPSVSSVKPLNPTRDSDGVTKIVHNLGPFHTGYRMQKYVQVSHSAKLGTQSSNVSFAARDIETRMYAFTYTPKIEWKSAVPKWIILNPIGGGFGSTIWSSYVWCDVTFKISYIPNTRPPAGWTGYEYGSKPASGDPPIIHYPYPPYGNNGPLFGGDEWYGPHPNGASHYMQNGNAPSTVNPWLHQVSHATGALPTVKTHIYSPQNINKISYYSIPVKISSGNTPFYARQYYSPPVDLNYTSYGAQAFSNIVIRPNTQLASGTIPSSPNNMKIWRRKIT